MTGSAEIDAARLLGCLRARLPGMAGVLRVERIAGGQSNPTYCVTSDSHRLVLRKQPPGELLPSAHAIDREFRVMTALRGTAVPVPECLFCEADAGVIGTPFYVMTRLEGRVFAVLDWELSTLGDPLADLAFNAMAWRCAPEEYGGIAGLDLDALGIPSEEAHVADYLRAARPGPGLWPFHFVFALWRFAVIFEGIAGRVRAGTAAAADAGNALSLSRAFARRALEAIDGPPPYGDRTCPTPP